jgi:phage tail sheath protein FI
MPVTTSYPGIYIEEIPNSNRSIAAAPTSIAAFVGYAHPLRTPAGNFGSAVLVFSFSEYEREFGGLFISGNVLGDLPLAVYQFFLNGGAMAYIVGLDPHLTVPPMVINTTAGSFTLDALEPTGPIAMTVSVTPNGSNAGIADIAVTYGTRVETFRNVKIEELESRLKGSSLVRLETPVTVTAGDTFPIVAPSFGSESGGAFAASDFLAVFQADTPLDKVDIFNLLILPGVTDNGILSAALSFAERKRAFLIMDPAPSLVADPVSGAVPPADIGGVFAAGTIPQSPNGAIYFPYLKSQHPVTSEAIEVAPSGYVAGVFARTDTKRGVWKAPAGLEAAILNTTGVVDDGRMTDLRQGLLNTAGVNVIRTFPGVGTVVYGARTLVSVAQQPWRYVPVRRTALFIEQTLFRELKWTIFEPNDSPLWVAITSSVGGFMLSLFNQGAFQGSKPSEAFLVKCDSTTTTQTDIDNGIVNIIVGFRPLKPAEFVIIKIAQLAGQAQS